MGGSSRRRSRVGYVDRGCAEAGEAPPAHLQDRPRGPQPLISANVRPHRTSRRHTDRLQQRRF
jgi:hypothetical protein